MTTDSIQRDRYKLPTVGDVVTIPGETRVDRVTRVGIVTEVGDYSDRLGGHLLTLRSVRTATTWVDTWNPDAMVVARVGNGGDCGHEITGRPAPARDAQGALRACMAQYLDDARGGRQSEQWHAARDGAAAMLHHLAMVTLGLSDEAATEWLAEELQDMTAARD